MLQTETVKEELKTYVKRISKISIWNILAYIIIYSVIGFCIETIFGMINNGVIESRKSFLYGPVCAIYGIGAAIMIPLLTPLKKNNNRLFFAGFFLGSILEYLISLFGEMIFHVKWWDYYAMPLNINGRICLYYSVFWGLLGMFLVSYINPHIDKFIKIIKKKFTKKTFNITVLTISIILFIDFLISSAALDAFYTRTIVEKNIKVTNQEEIDKKYKRIYGNETLKKVIYNHFGNEKMIKAFPNLKLTDANNKIIFFTDIYTDIKPYYLKLFDVEPIINRLKFLQKENKK